MGSALAASLARHWWRQDRSLIACLLWPVSRMYAALAALARRRVAVQAPVPVVVVGNVVVGGAGKTPSVIALVQGLQARGWRPGVISRGYGRTRGDVRPVVHSSTAAEVGDEPRLIARRTQVPVWVGARRIDAARALCAAHPTVDVLVCDDGLQHHALARAAELIVFDQRGVGNGWLLPAGPLRQALPQRLQPHQRVLYNAAAPSTPLPGSVAQRELGPAVPLQAWQSGHRQGAVPLHALRGRTLLAAAGIGEPERFFSMLEAQGLTIERLPLPDHHPYLTLPWPAQTADVVVTEKDAIKLPEGGVPGTAVWVVGLDFKLPAALIDELAQLLRSPHPT